jgi:hypothetical protein
MYLISDELRRTIHLWLSAPDPSSNHNDARKKHQPTTGLWFIKDNKFEQWKCKLNSFIWLHGIHMFYHSTFHQQCHLTGHNSWLWQISFMASINESSPE